MPPMELEVEATIAHSFFRGHAGPAGGRGARGRHASRWPGEFASAEGRPLREAVPYASE